MVNVKGKWALITGASRGIGYLSAVFMAEQGANLILHSRDAAHCEKVLAEVQALGVEAYAVSAELSEPDSVQQMLAEIDAKGTQVDIVLNNAGLQIAYRTDYLATPYTDYDISFRINTVAPMLICYHFLPKMAERGFGRIVNTTSGIDLEPEQAGYSAAKAALNKVTHDIGKTSADQRLRMHPRALSRAYSWAHSRTTRSRDAYSRLRSSRGSRSRRQLQRLSSRTATTRSAKNIADGKENRKMI